MLEVTRIPISALALFPAPALISPWYRFWEPRLSILYRDSVMFDVLASSFSEVFQTLALGEVNEPLGCNSHRKVLCLIEDNLDWFELWQESINKDMLLDQLARLPAVVLLLFGRPERSIQ